MGVDPVLVDIDGLIYPENADKVKIDRTNWTAEQLLRAYLADPRKYMAKSGRNSWKFAFYGPGFIRFSVLKEWGAYMSIMKILRRQLKLEKRLSRRLCRIYYQRKAREMLMGSKRISKADSEAGC
jgi:hypothetical protein